MKAMYIFYVHFISDLGLSTSGAEKTEGIREPKFVCGYCEKRFFNKPAMICHMKEHKDKYGNK